MRPPKKFTDATKSEITPEWQEWWADQSDDRREIVDEHLLGIGEFSEDHFPEEHEKDLGTGCWIIVVEEPFTELKRRFSVPTPSLWWARPQEGRIGGYPIGSGLSKAVVPGRYRAVIETPGGSLWLFPHEYVICENPIPLITDPECTIHPLGGRPVLDEEKLEQMFYLQSRGIKYSDALLMLMEGVDMRHWGWVEFPEYVRAAFEGVGRRLVVAR